MSEPPQQRPAPQAHPPQNYPPQNYPPQNYPPQNYPPQNYPPQNHPPQSYPSQNYPAQNPQTQPYPLGPAGPYPVQPQYRRGPRKPSEELHRDAEAALAARMELGPEYNEYVAEGLAERVEDIAEARAAELRQQALDASRAQAAEQSGRGRQFALAIVSVVMGIPITAITATNVDPSVVGVAVSWAGIVGVNWIHARSLRRRK
ncbi:MAG: hypothetical protein ACJ72M_15295 [Propionibacteriaceae bacterium]|jgi:hypothetical protein